MLVLSTTPACNLAFGGEIHLDATWRKEAWTTWKISLIIDPECCQRSISCLFDNPLCMQDKKTANCSVAVTHLLSRRPPWSFNSFKMWWNSSVETPNARKMRRPRFSVRSSCTYDSPCKIDVCTLLLPVALRASMVLMTHSSNMTRRENPTRRFTIESRVAASWESMASECHHPWMRSRWTRKAGELNTQTERHGPNTTSTYLWLESKHGTRSRKIRVQCSTICSFEHPTNVGWLVGRHSTAVTQAQTQTQPQPLVSEHPQKQTISLKPTQIFLTSIWKYILETYVARQKSWGAEDGKTILETKAYGFAMGCLLT